MEEIFDLKNNSSELPLQNVMPAEAEEEGLDIMNLVFRCVNNWYWFVICGAIALTLAFFKVKRQEPIYSKTATILIKEEATGSAASKLGVQEDMGVFKSTNTVQNEMIAIRSPQVVTDVVKRLKLYMNYSTEGRFHNETLYGWNLPVEVLMEDVQEEEWRKLTLNLHKDGTFSLTDFDNSKEVVKGNMNDKVHTPIGNVQVIPSPGYTPIDKKIFVQHSAVSSAAGGCTGALSVTRQSEKTSVVNLTYVDVSPQRAEDFLNMLIVVYSEYWVNDRNQIMLKTNDFISERISVIEQELGHVDGDISSYKSRNLIPSLAGSIGQNMNQAAAANSEVVGLTNQLTLTKYLLQYLKDKQNSFELIPAVDGTGSVSVEGMISSYNEKLLERNQLVANSNEENPLVKEMDKELSTLYGVMLSSVQNQITTLDIQLRATQSVENRATDKMATNPEQEKYLLSVERQQAVKQALYTYLLQKREENELSQAFTAYNTRLLNPPSGGWSPIAPDSNKIYMTYLAAGLGIPLILIVLLELFNNTVRGRKDLEYMKTPFLGEIPYVRNDRRSFLVRLISTKDLKHFLKNEPVIMRAMMKLGVWRKSDKDSDKNMKLFVKPGSRNQINEAFRVVRSNMDFVKSEDKNRVIMITSANAGSGKTFISLNLAASFVVKGRKVLVVDLDFRKRSLSKYVEKPKKGLSDYLAGRTQTYKDLIIHGSLMPNLDVLPVGTIPPNPTELLYEDNLKDMLDELRGQYDMIFLDCPPVEIVADASIIAKYADKTIFLIRAGLLQRNMLSEIDRFYFTKKFGNMTVMLNGTDDNTGKYGYSKYGYRYGYHYGYGGHYASEGYIDN